MTLSDLRHIVELIPHVARGERMTPEQRAACLKLADFVDGTQDSPDVARIVLLMPPTVRPAFPIDWDDEM